MLGNIVKGFSGIFGSKAGRDFKELQPFVDQVNGYYTQYTGLSHDALRAKTTEFRARIADHLSDIDSEIKVLRDQIDAASFDMVNEKEAWYNEIDKLEDKRNESLEVVLEEILPEAFALVKETARRFTEEDTVFATATDYDRDLAASRPHIEIKGSDVVYHTKWLAAGAEVNWNMVHYDVQLIGGVVLHKGKIAEMAT